MKAFPRIQMTKQASILLATAALLTTGLFNPVSADGQAETAAEAAARVALELQAENLLVTIHHAPLDAELEPCINGGVSASGRFATQALEDAVEHLATGELNRHLENSAYYQAFNDGRVRLTD